MAIAFACSCGESIRVADAFAGRRMKCPECGTLVVVPGGNGEMAAPVAGGSAIRGAPAANGEGAGRHPIRTLLDLAFALVLAGALGVVFLMDSRAPASVPAPIAVEPPPIAEEAEPEAPPPPPRPEFRPEPPAPVDPAPRVVLGRTTEGRFGLSTTTGNPDDPGDDRKRLTYDPNGATNNTRVFVDGRAPLFGGPEGDILQGFRREADGASHYTWRFAKVRVDQAIAVIPGEVSRRMDTIRVTYTCQNQDGAPHRVGLRVMLDTLIGDNDGVPFIVPGREGIVTAPEGYRGEAVPDFVRALERPDLANPGVIVDIGLKPESNAGERPAEVILTHWPGQDAEWDYDRQAPFVVNGIPDSAAGLFYAPGELAPGASRSVSFTYGLGTISSTQTHNPSLSLTAGGPFRSGGKFWLVALVQHPKEGQTVRVDLPEGLGLADDAEASKPVPPGDKDYTQVSWLVSIAPTCFGDVVVKATLDPGQIEEAQTLNVQPRDAKLTLLSEPPYAPGRAFWVAALVQDPREGQAVELTLPDGLTLARDHPARKAVPKARGRFSQITWLVQVGRRASGTLTLTAKLSPDGAEESKEISVQAGNLIR